MNTDCEKKRKHAKNIGWVAFVFVVTITFMVFILAVTGHAGDLKDFNSILVTVIGGMITLCGASVGLQGWYK